MTAIASAPPWNPEDDLLLKNAVEAGASLEALAKGAVRFSRKFTVRELRERWRSLLYDADVSAQASARMAEFERSNPSASSKPGRFGVSKGGGSVGADSPAKRRVESVRRHYYEMRKRLCSFNTFDLGFIDEPNDNTENVNSGNDLFDGSYVVGDHVKNYFEFAVNSCSLLDNRQKDLCLSTSGSVKDNNGQNINAEQNFRNCSSVAEAGTSHVLPDVPLWKTMVDVSAPELPIDVSLEVKCQDVEQNLMCRDHEDGDKSRSPGYNVDHSGLMLEERLPNEELNRNIAISGDDYGDISDSLLNFANENEPLAMDVDGENMDDKACYVGIKLVQVSSPTDGQKKDIPSVSQLENLDPKTFSVLSEGVCDAEKKDSTSLLHSGEANQSICSSEINIPSIKSVSNPHSPELHYEMMECTLNSEDPDIPCNDEVIQPSDLVPSFTDQENRGQESISLKKEQSPAESLMASQIGGHRTAPKTSPNFPLVKPEPFDGTHVSLVSKRATIILADASQCRPTHTTPAFAANQVLKEEGINAPVTIKGEHTLLSKEPGSTNRDGLEPEANPSSSRLYQDDSEEELEGDDVPYFSDIENMILEMDLSPDDDDSYLSKKVSQYQHEDAKRNIVRLEQCARSSMQRAIAFQGAFAIVYGRQLKHYIKETEVILGRATEDNEVDIDLGKEGRANKISRRQALIKMEEDGSFFLKNIGKSSIFLNGKEVATGQRRCLSSSTLIEISGMSFVFEMNHKSIRRYLVNVGKNSKEKYAKFEWSPKEKQ